MKRLIWIIVIAAAVIALILLKPVNKDAIVGPPASKKIIPVEGRIIKTAPVSNIIKVSGNIMSNEEVNLQSQIAGVITEVNFTEGAHISKGELLVKIDDAQYQAQLQKDEVAKQLDQVTVDRTKKLLDINGVSQQDYDIASNNLNSVIADMKVIEVSIGYCSIRAPFDGVIGLKNVSPGSYINTGTVITDIEQLSPIKIDFFVPEKYSGQLKKDDSVQFNVSGYDETFSGIIYAIDPKIEQTSGGMHVRALSPNKNGRLLPGQFANISIVLSHVDNAIMIPTEAVIPKVIGQNVYVYKGGKAFSEPIELGLRTDSTVEVTKGLNPGDTIITRGSMVIYPGSKVILNSLR
ncbi:MAG TPA: efflux RND transporter periplasmic adaptor subunit [Bacteroidia bacterium]|jgi:membrane fusion protein (multidrug efflux system)|nr:efflux RND transporter periplasmic adaptor subunit [Bacteroidia bacterium]